MGDKDSEMEDFMSDMSIQRTSVLQTPARNIVDSTASGMNLLGKGYDASDLSTNASKELERSSGTVPTIYGEYSKIDNKRYNLFIAPNSQD